MSRQYEVEMHFRNYPDYRPARTRERRLRELEAAAVKLCKHADEHGIDRDTRQRVERVMALLDDTFAPKVRTKR